ncbi:MAG: ABC transporter ATP-binding protein [Deltaproteobacteria bacterium]|nr:ABC transporter ATP-binding protein [Deltaproteobacteria bacterium]
MPLLEINDLGIDFGGLHAVDGFNAALEPGELVGLIGPNGAGKTTVFNLISSFHPPSRGLVYLLGEKITGLKPYQVAERGIVRTFQNIRLFKELSVVDNVRIAHHPFARYGIFDAIFRNQRFHTGQKLLHDEAMDLLATFGLMNRASEIAKNLPYGEQRKLEIARALATKPKLLLLDEPAAGMNPQEAQSLMELIEFIKERFSLTIFLIEHQMRVVMGICRRILVMDFGKIIAQGNPREIQNNPMVIEAYLGRKSRRHAPRD